jgi:hypothetical protein
MIRWKTGIGFPDRAWIFLVTGPEIRSGIQTTSSVNHDRAVGRIELVSRVTSSVKFINVCRFSHVFFSPTKKQQFQMPLYRLAMTTFLHILGITIFLRCLKILNAKLQISTTAGVVTNTPDSHYLLSLRYQPLFIYAFYCYVISSHANFPPKFSIAFLFPYPYNLPTQPVSNYQT